MDTSSPVPVLPADRKYQNFVLFQKSDTLMISLNICPINEEPRSKQIRFENPTFVATLS